jgi:hypothetical protein
MEKNTRGGQGFKELKNHGVIIVVVVIVVVFVFVFASNLTIKNKTLKKTQSAFH